VAERVVGRCVGHAGLDLLGQGVGRFERLGQRTLHAHNNGESAGGCVMVWASFGSGRWGGLIGSGLIS